MGLRTYQVLAERDEWWREEEILAAVPAPALAVKRGLTALCYHGLARQEGWSRYRWAGGLFRNWASRYAPATAAPVDIAPWSALRTLLSDLYGRPDDARRLAADSGLDLAQIKFDTTLINLWHELLREAHKQGRLEVLVAQAGREYPAQAQALQDAYRAGTSAGG